MHLQYFLVCNRNLISIGIFSAASNRKIPTRHGLTIRKFTVSRKSCLELAPSLAHQGLGFTSPFSMILLALPSSACWFHPHVFSKMAVAVLGIEMGPESLPRKNRAHLFQCLILRSEKKLLWSPTLTFSHVAIVRIGYMHIYRPMLGKEVNMFE